MSAPRKIWAASPAAECLFAARDHRMDERDHIYHHDDVVRELVEALEECRDELDAYSRQEYPGDHPVHERYRKRDFDANPARIALAKIAQEG